MKRNDYLHLLAIMMVALLSIGVTSCKDDDPDESVIIDSGEEKEPQTKSSLLIGTWDGSFNLILRTDGSCKLTYRNSKVVDIGTYSYNESQNILVIMIDNPGESRITRTFVVQTLTQTTLVLIESDGDSCSFTRQ